MKKTNMGPLNQLALCEYKKYPTKIKRVRQKQLADFYNQNFLLSPWSSSYFKTFLGDQQKRKMLCFVLEKKQKIIGFILGRVVGNINDRYNLTTLLVDKKYRGRGYSKLLLDIFLQSVSRKKNIQKVYLHFRNSNDFENFYKHYGFSKHRISGHYSNGEKKHYMEINL